LTVRQHYDYKLSDSQDKILKVIGQNPGIRYRELARQTGYANGVLTYHLNSLEQDSFINKVKHDNITRYYPINIPSEDLKIISHLRVHSERNIILFVLNHDLCTFNEIVEQSGKAPSTISWHLRKLSEDGILSVHHGEYNLYQVKDKKLVNQLLLTYKESLMDKVVNNLVEIVDEL
jgi:predicted transcriptional regulator